MKPAVNRQPMFPREGPEELAEVNLFCITVDHHQCILATLDHRGPPWIIMDHAGSSGTTLDHYGPRWITMENTGSLYMHNGQNWISWTTLDQPGPHWINTGSSWTTLDSSWTPGSSWHAGSPRTILDHTLGALPLAERGCEARSSHGHLNTWTLGHLDPLDN